MLNTDFAILLISLCFGAALASGVRARLAKESKDRRVWALEQIARCGNGQGDSMLDLSRWALGQPMPEWARARIEERYRKQWDGAPELEEARAIAELDDEDYRRQLEATPTPGHWRPIEGERGDEG